MLKQFIVRDFMEGHICRQNTLMLALVFCFELHARAARTCCHCHLAVKIRFMTACASVKTAKKSHERYHSVVMWHWLCTNGVEATKCWVFIAHFSIYSNSRCCCHAGTDIPRLRGHTRQINQVVRTVGHRISCCAPTIHWKCDAQKPNRQIKSHQPFENTCHSNVLGLSLLWMARGLACF